MSYKFELERSAKQCLPVAADFCLDMNSVYFGWKKHLLGGLNSGHFELDL